MTLGVSDVPGPMEKECWCQGAGEAGGYKCGSPKGHHTTQMPGITGTSIVVSCEMGRWKLLVLRFFFSPRKNKGIVLFWMNAWGTRLQHPSLTVQKAVLSLLPHPLAGVPGERLCTIPKKRLENNFPQCRWGAWMLNTLLDDEGRRDRKGYALALPPCSAVSHLVWS